MTEHIDVLIVGAGLSGIGAASHLQRQRPADSFVILESRAAVGGTWDLFRYPGVRSDSDMYTLGYSFRPWKNAKAIADGESIREYITDTVADEQLEPHLRLNHRVISAAWSTESARWTVTAEHAGETVTFSCRFLSVCSGYYRYDEGFTPAIDGLDTFDGPIVHPQHWPDDLDYAGKRVVIVGSGATAVTLVPSLAREAQHVTMLQRSPTYIAPVPSRDHLADRLRGRLPAQAAYTVVRAKNIACSMFTYQLSRRRPETMKGILRKSAVAKLPAGFAVDTHLAPTYQPWDQRLCAIPDGDLYRAISAEKADIVTDRISRVTPTGIRLASGGDLDADIIVLATGLNLLVMGGMTLSVDGRAVDVSRTLTYKGMMLAGVPNFSLTIGYTNASWTLKADLVARYVGRLLGYLERHHYDYVVPQAPTSVSSGALVSLIDLQAGYVLRSVDQLPKQGAHAPWRLHQNYLRDFRLLRAGRLTDDVRFGRRGGLAIPPDPLALPGTATITIDGARVRYRVTGQGDPVLLLHGIGQSLDDFTEQHDRLSARHTVYSLDLPGFGYSARRPGTASLATLAGVLPAFLDTMGVHEPVPVVGNSLGGAVAMTFAAAHPERVSSLVLVDSAGFGSEVALVLRLLAVRPLARVLMRPNAENSARTVRAVFYEASLATPERVAHSFALSRRRSHAATTLDLARELGTFRGVRPQWRAALLAKVRRLGIPTLVVWGDHDHILPFSHLAAARTALPDAQTHVFANTGHMPQIERPDEFAEVLERFLADHDRANSAQTAFSKQIENGMAST
ncbi:alpha/beta fold hydrolase [Subtercola endophyticus]|uniref:alpha/beta fold hydrolase n=1 Tax=Subtercola endophyticus TaxID=2895559 RepID=UPI001E5C2BC5|nr:alpha/beta fold hydrolase [Subtercola endophyticus]UFS59225.1 alpha/beta fold hydrolase [Subtercola endophyticus]